jgi:hypothetical protein
MNKYVRIDHMIEQYVWTLENDQAFVTSAKGEVQRGNFNTFRRLCGSYIKDVRHQLGEMHTEGINGYEWAFLYLETWVRMGGFNILMSNLYYDNDVRFQLDRLETAGLGVSRNGIIEVRATNKPAGEVRFTFEELESKSELAEPEKEEPVSNQIEIKNVTFINKVDVTTMSDEQLIDAIKTIEGEIAALKAVKAKSTKIKAKVEEAEATLAKVVEILDAR